MKKLIACIAVAAASMSVFAAPQVSDVVMTQDGGRTVTISYTLANEPGIVTVDVQTNAGDMGWVSIGGQHLTYFAGDANKLVQPGQRTITWKPRKAWPDNAVTENVKAVVSAWATNAPPDYMAVSLTVTNAVNYYTCAENVPFGVTHEMYKTEYLLLRKIPAANVQWRMGSPTTENGRTAASETPHLVTLDEDYYIGVYPVTQRQYELMMSKRPSNFKLDADYATRPVENVSYDMLRGKATDGYDWPNNGHAVLSTGFIGKLRAHAGIVGFDLPTDAQWEFACRAGCGSALYNGKELEDTTTSTNLNPLGRYRYNGGWGPTGATYPGTTCTADMGTAKVGSYEPNAWGIYDMLGNVWEWCLDWYQESPLGFDVATGPSTGTARVWRGGSFNGASSPCRAAYRAGPTPNSANLQLGFRLACSIGQP